MKKILERRAKREVTDEKAGKVCVYKMVRNLYLNLLLN